MSSSDPELSLLGRREECDALGHLMVNVRMSRSQVLVLRGEAGVGKTALLNYLLQSATECRVAQAVGVESEMELAYAGLHQLCAPMLHELDLIAEPQRVALSTALGLSTGLPPDRFVVGLAVLSLMAELAVEQPLICVIDDAQWLDRISAQTLSFVARRLAAERIAMVFAVREVGEEHPLAGLPEAMIRGLQFADARALLDSAMPGRVDDQVRDRIVAETRGNPLAILESPWGFSAAEQAAGYGRPDARPLTSQMEQTFLHRVGSLPSETQRLLLTAAAEPLGDVSLLRRAADWLGIDLASARPAEAAGLLELGDQVRFRHPLVRSAAYRAAGQGDRQQIHAALAEVTDPITEPDRRAWHRAHAAPRPDEEVAAELERSADRAQSRGGVAAAAAFLQRATELTPDPARRGVRALAAAEAKLAAAAADAASELLATAELGPLDDLQRARLARLRAQIVFARKHGSDATPLFLAAAEQLQGLDDELARETYLEAFGAAIFAGRLDSRRTLRRIAEAARSASPTRRLPRPIDLLLEGLATRFTDGYVESVPVLRRALDAFRREGKHGKDDVTGWLWLAWLIAADLWDYQTSFDLATQAVRDARAAGTLTVLPVALAYRAGVHVFAGEFDAAAGLSEEADAITAATGHAPVKTTLLVLAALRGNESQTLHVMEVVVKDATVRGEGRVLGLAGYATAVLYNGLACYDAALVGAQRACEHDDLGFYGWSLAELVEAAVRTGARDVAADALGVLERRAVAADADWALGFLARSRALLSDGQAADSLYQEGITRLGRTPIVVHLARAHLLYGEWLRREHRRVDARNHLRVAHEMLARIGAEAFAERARRELVATGETVRKRAGDAPGALTPQEAQIARLAADGLTNPEIGAQLFISRHTVEWHLRKVFTKFDITSRKQLRAKLPRADSPVAPA